MEENIEDGLMFLPGKIKPTEEFVDENGNPRTDVAILKDYLVCHPETLNKAITAFHQMMGIQLEVITEEEPCEEKKNIGISRKIKG